LLHFAHPENSASLRLGEKHPSKSHRNYRLAKEAHRQMQTPTYFGITERRETEQLRWKKKKGIV
jgi:hypothetical protein